MKTLSQKLTHFIFLLLKVTIRRYFVNVLDIVSVIRVHSQQTECGLNALELPFWGYCYFISKVSGYYTGSLLLVFAAKLNEKVNESLLT